MSTDLVTYTAPASDLHAQMDYARAVQSAAMLPEAYRGKPADIMLAVGLGQSMGLSPAESLYRINVIKGKPTASAELIAANVRKAGHRLRVHTDGLSVTASVWRHDDPDFEHQVVRDEKWAKNMGLLSGTNYQKQAQTMLQWRAISAVARLACPEALYGVAYTPDEMWETDDKPAQTTATSARDRMASILGTDVAGEDKTTAPDTEPPDPRDNARKRMFAALNERGITDRDDQLRGIVHIIDREVESRGDLTETEYHQVADVLQAQAPVETTS